MGKMIRDVLLKDKMLTVTTLLAIVSMFIVPPHRGYVDYIDFPMLTLLFCLMAVVAGLRSCGLFDFACDKLLKRYHDARLLAAMLVGLCFFSSMFITNDVALITFVPLTLLLLARVSVSRLIFVLVLETLAANIGSMLTPVGNPQNLYIYAHFNLHISDFIAVVFPVWLLGLVMLTLALVLRGSNQVQRPDFKRASHLEHGKLLRHALLFIVCALTVLRLLSDWTCLAVTLAVLLIWDRKLFARIDYALLGTFIGLFVLVGNLGHLPWLKSELGDMIAGRVFFSTVLLGQFIGNMPAMVMISGFTDEVKELLLAANVGRLGTPIASFASLITLRFYLNHPGARPWLFAGIFMGISFSMLAIYCVFVTLWY